MYIMIFLLYKPHTNKLTFLLCALDTMFVICMVALLTVVNHGHVKSQIPDVPYLKGGVHNNAKYWILLWNIHVGEQSLFIRGGGWRNLAITTAPPPLRSGSPKSTPFPNPADCNLFVIEKVWTFGAVPRKFLKFCTSRACIWCILEDFHLKFLEIWYPPP